MTAALTLTGLGHRYPGDRWALRECSVAVPSGRVVALVGANGAGKTTLLNIAAGLLRPTVGTVQVAGRAPDRQLAKIGYVAQDAPLWPRLRVGDVLELGRCTNPGFDAQFAGARIQSLDIPRRARVNTLSGGQRAQVALTLVLAKRPELLLLDEPLANLDPLARREFLASMFASCGLRFVNAEQTDRRLTRDTQHVDVASDPRCSHRSGPRRHHPRTGHLETEPQRAHRDATGSATRLDLLHRAAHRGRGHPDHGPQVRPPVTP